MNETERELGTYAFDTVPRAGETISLPDAEGDLFRHFKVEHVTHRAQGAQKPSTTFLFVAKAV